MRLPLLFATCATILLAGCSNPIDVANNDSRALVASIRQANANSGPDTIRLARRGTYVLAEAATPGLLLPPITGDLTIEGGGAEIRNYASGSVALLEVASGTTVVLQRLSLAEGTDGAIRNFGHLTLESTRVVDSIGTRVQAIVLNHGTLVARDSEFAYNSLQSGRRDAGTLLNYGELQLHNTRIHHNHVQRLHHSLVAAGAVLNMGMVKLRNAQLENNFSDDSLVLSEQPGLLSFSGILNLGNGRTEGEFPAGLVREGSQPALPISGR